MKCPNCDFDNPPEMRFCGMCGTSLTRTCSNCEYVNPVNFRFCGMCGTPLQNEINGRAASLLRYSQPAVASARPALLQGGFTQSAQEEVGQASLNGERRVASVIFADVKGSTELLERLGTEAWVEVMNRVFQVLETEIYRYCGEVGQFRGDGLVAFFGAKSADEDDPEHAVQAALAMQEAIQPLSQDLLQKEGIELIMRVGVNTGEIIVANVGDSRQYSEDTAMGEALTVAARMETAAEPGTVLVSENTYRLVRSSFDWQPLGEITVKGISHPIPVYRPLAYRRTGAGGQDNQMFGFVHSLISRKNEFNELKQRIEDLTSGRGGIFVLTGMKGMGKSFLVEQVQQHFNRQNVLLAAAAQKEMPGGPVVEGNPASPSIRWLHGRCRSYGHLRPYSVWLDLIHEWIGAHLEDQVSEVLSIVRSQIETQVGGDVGKDYPNLAPFLSTPNEETSTERIRHSDAEGMKRQFFQTVSSWIEELAQSGPLVISLADLQWSDGTSLELLEYCLPLCDTQPVLWLISFRPERDTNVREFQHRLETNYPHRLSQVVLPPLSQEETEEFLDQFLGPSVLYPETRALVIKKAEGNPYFVKELIFAMAAQGVLAIDGDTNKWQQTRPLTSLDLPDSLQSLLMARIDRLAPGERRLLQMAAVVGSVFWLNALQALAGPTVPIYQLQNDLVSLQRDGLIHERAHVEDLGMEYAFDSSLIREVAYESLLNPQRMSYHLQVAEFLEEIVFREGKRRYFNILAHHYRLGGDIKKELFYTLQAADRAQNIYANAEALKYFTRALDLLDQIEVSQSGNGHQHYAIRTQRFEALNGRRAVYFLMGNLEAGWEDAQALLPLARQMEQDPTWLIDALLQQPAVASPDTLEELQAGMPLAQEALDLAIKIGDKRREMNCLLVITSQRNLLSDLSWTETGDRALALAREIGDRQYEAMILLGLGHSYIKQDEQEKGMAYLNAALPICEELDDKVTQMTWLRVMSDQVEREGDHYRRLTDYELKRLEIARAIGDRFEEANALMFCGQIQALNLGDLEGGLALLQESNNIMKAVSGRLFPLLRIAQVQVALGQFDEASDTLEEAGQLADQNVFNLGRIGYKLVTVLRYNAIGDSHHLNLALDVTREISAMEMSQLVSRQYLMAASSEAAAAHLKLARLAKSEAERMEHNRQALEHTQKAVEIYESYQFVDIIECACEEIYFRHSQTLEVHGQTEKAAVYLELANDEMMRKYDMIPQESPFRRTYLENLAYHREIRDAHTAATLAKLSAFRDSRHD